MSFLISSYILTDIFSIARHCGNQKYRSWGGSNTIGNGYQQKKRKEPNENSQHFIPYPSNYAFKQKKFIFCRKIEKL